MSQQLDQAANTLEAALEDQKQAPDVAWHIVHLAERALENPASQQAIRTWLNFHASDIHAEQVCRAHAGRRIVNLSRRLARHHLNDEAIEKIVFQEFPVEETSTWADGTCTHEEIREILTMLVRTRTREFAHHHRQH